MLLLSFIAIGVVGLVFVKQFNKRLIDLKLELVKTTQDLKQKIEKLEHTTVVVAHIYPNRSDSLTETDADEYIKSNSLNHTWKGKSMVMFSKWCENVNTCPVTNETRDNIIDE